MLLTNYNQFHGDLYGRGLEYAVEHTLALGFNSVEFLAGVPHTSKIIPDAEAAVKVKEYLDAYGLSVPCYSVGANLYAPDRAEEVWRAFMDHAEIAAALGAKFLHHTFYLVLNRPANAPSYDEFLKAVLEPAERIADYCAMQGMTCLYEPQGIYVNGVEGLGRLLAEMRSRCRNVGVCGDVGNPLYADTDPRDIFDRFAADVKHVHIKNYLCHDAPDVEGLKWSRTDGGKYLASVPLYEGEIDIAHCLRRLKEVGYDGAYAMEFAGNDELMIRSLDHFKAIYREVFGK